MATETLRPNANGDTNTWDLVPGTGESAWENVDEAVSDDDTTRNWTNVANEVDLYNLATTAIDPADTINSVTAYWQIKRYGISYYDGFHGIKSGGTEYWKAEETFTAAYIEHSEVYNTDPATSAAWTVAGLNALQIGGKSANTGTGGMRISQCYIVVDYTAAGITEFSESAIVYIGVVASATRAVTFTRSASVIVGVVATATRVLAATRAASVIVGIVATATRVVNYPRSASVIIGVVATATRAVAFTRSASVVIGVVVTATKTSTASAVGSLLRTIKDFSGRVVNTFTGRTINDATTRDIQSH